MVAPIEELTFDYVLEHMEATENDNKHEHENLRQQVNGFQRDPGRREIMQTPSTTPVQVEKRICI